MLDMIDSQPLSSSVSVSQLPRIKSQSELCLCLQVQKLKLDMESAMLEIVKWQPFPCSVWMQLLSWMQSQGEKWNRVSACIKVQKLKVDTESAMLEIDQILKANELSIALVAAVPSFLIAGVSLVGIWRWLSPKAVDPKWEALPCRCAHDSSICFTVLSWYSDRFCSKLILLTSVCPPSGVAFQWGCRGWSPIALSSQQVTLHQNMWCQAVVVFGNWSGSLCRCTKDLRTFKMPVMNADSAFASFARAMQLKGENENYMPWGITLGASVLRSSCILEMRTSTHGLQWSALWASVQYFHCSVCKDALSRCSGKCCKFLFHAWR